MSRTFSLAVASALGALVAAGFASAGTPIKTAVYIQPGETEIAFDRARDAGASMVRLLFVWSRIAPTTRPSGFDPADPADPAYRWAEPDRFVRFAAAKGLEPFVTVMSAPRWAEDARGLRSHRGEVRPDPAELAAFARAAARRYSGRFGGLPRVRYWEVWNEPNLTWYLAPQFENRRPFAPGLYRQMVNAFAAAVDDVNRDNVVIAGATSPLSDIDPAATRVNPAWGPLSFMREMLCLSRSLKPKCRTRVRFDVWSHHPYTSGSPTHQAPRRDEVSLGDLPEMRRTLDAAARAGHIVSSRKIGFWVTEFSWDSNPPDPGAAPVSLLTRWVAESIYRMSEAGVSVATWLTLRDSPIDEAYVQAGLFFRGATLMLDRPKPILRAFRFPVVALPRAKAVLVWGRAPAGRPGRVIIEQSFKGGWKVIGVVRTDRHGIFQRRFKTSAQGFVRARIAGTREAAPPFSIKAPPDRKYPAFGSNTLHPAGK